MVGILIPSLFFHKDQPKKPSTIISSEKTFDSITFINYEEELWIPSQQKQWRIALSLLSWPIIPWQLKNELWSRWSRKFMRYFNSIVPDRPSLIRDNVQPL